MYRKFFLQMEYQKYYLSLFFTVFLGFTSAAQTFISSDDVLYPGTWSNRTDGNGNRTMDYFDMTNPNKPNTWNSEPYQDFILLPRDDEPNQYIWKQNCRILYPQGYEEVANENKKYPVFLFLHGLGEAGVRGGRFKAYETTDARWHNNDHNLMHGGAQFMKAARPDLWNSLGRNTQNTVPLDFKFPGFVVVPQNRKEWTLLDMEYAVRVIEVLIRTERIDENRIYVNGLSDGGMAVWEIINAYPHLFAAALPMSGILNDVTYKQDVVNNILHIPTWIFNGGTDTDPNPEQVSKAIDFISSLGGTPRHKEYPLLGHGIWNNAWSEPDFWSWMQQFSKLKIHPYFGKTEFCDKAPFSTQLGVSPGFDGYRWKKVIGGVETIIVDNTQQNVITVDEYGDYFVQINRRGKWTEWSEPLSITIKELTPVPEIYSQLSTTLPALDKEFTILKGPEGFESYQWYKDGDAIAGATNSELSTTEAGSFQLVTTETDGCPSNLSLPFIVSKEPFSGNLPAGVEKFDGDGISSTEILLTWQDASNNEEGFEIYRRSDGSSDFELVALLSKNSNQYTDNGLSPESNYFYVIRAFNDNGGSAYSDEIMISTPLDSQNPSPPQNLQVNSKTRVSIDLTWEKSVDNVGIDHYLVHAFNVSDDQLVLGSPFLTTELMMKIDNLEHEKIYKYYVEAVDFAGNVSNPSNQLVERSISNGLYYNYYVGGIWDVIDDWDDGAHPVSLSGNIANFDIRTISDGGVRPDAETDYYAFEFIGELFITTPGEYTFYTNSDDGSGLWIGKEGSETYVVDNDGLHGMQKRSGTIELSSGPHRIVVKFFERSGGDDLIVSYKGPDTGGNEIIIPDEALKSSTLDAPAGPLAPTLTSLDEIKANAVKVIWTDNSETENPATAFEVYRSLKQDEGFEIIARVDVLFYTDEDLLSGTTYHYKIKAVNGLGSSGFSNGMQATTLQNLPFVAAENADLTLLSSWQNSEGDTPDNFTSPRQTFIIQNNANLGDNWVITGNDALLVINADADINSNSNNIIVPGLKIEGNATLTVSQSNNKSNFSIGSGDLIIKNGGKLILHNNDLTLTGDASINPGNENGVIFVNDGDLIFNNNSSLNSHIYLDANQNTVNNLVINNQGTGAVILHNQLLIKNTLKLQEGLLMTNDNIVLLSDDGKTARLARVESNAFLQGNITLQRYIGPAKSRGWYNLGTALKGQTLFDWSDDFQIDGVGNGGNPNVRIYNEPEDNWESINTLGKPFEPGYAFQVFLYDGANGLQNGELKIENTGEPLIGDGNGDVNGFYQVPLTKSGSYDGGGWNLFANPYPSEIDWDAATGWDKTHVVNSYYVWDGAARKYKSYAGGIGTNGLTSIIPQGQAFFVYAESAGYLGVKEDAKVIAADNPTYLRKNLPDNAIFITMNDENGNSDECILRFVPEATINFDKNFDAFKLTNELINISTLDYSDKALAINTIPSIDAFSRLSLNVNASKPGRYTLEFKNLAQIKSERHIYLHDKIKDSVISLQNQSLYNFTINSDKGSQGSHRFEIILNPDKITVPGVMTDQFNQVIDQAEVIFTGVNYDQTLSVDQGNFELITNDFELPGKLFVADKFSEFQLSYSLVDLSMIAGQLVNGNVFNRYYQHIAADADRNNVLEWQDLDLLSNALIGKTGNLTQQPETIFFVEEGHEIDDPGLYKPEITLKKTGIPDYVAFKGIKPGEIVNETIGASGEISVHSPLASLEDDILTVTLLINDMDRIESLRSLHLSIDYNKEALEILSIQNNQDDARNYWSESGILNYLTICQSSSGFNQKMIINLKFRLKNNWYEEIVLGINGDYQSMAVSDALSIFNFKKETLQIPITENPHGAQLVNVYPNPFSHFVNLDIIVPGSQHLDVVIYDLIGNEVYRQIHEVTIGYNNLKLDLKQLKDTQPYVFIVNTMEGQIKGKLVRSAFENE